jgi:hypothetical protein
MSFLSEYASSQEATFKAKQIVAIAAFEKGLMVAPERVQIQLFHEKLENVVKALINIATQEEEVCNVPSDWWQHFKERWFPLWLKRKFPVRYDQWWAVHKFPEVDAPDFGSEYIHFKRVKWRDVEREAERELKKALSESQI